ncbi:nodulation protein NfeD [Trinickia sp. LjRoot230]|uniref:NfeD family protein n=1 Tax=Trinickia sp. LjRoot230 TaxID=3342288 RepID=UPI003ECDDAF9
METRPQSFRAPIRIAARYVRRATSLSAPLARVAVGLLLSIVWAVAAARTSNVIVIPVVGAIGPASADFITRGLNSAAHDEAALIVLELDTPGGLDTSMRQIIKAILASPVPVAAFVAPSGARAASAGTYIVYASHIAAMAPGTNLGAATPIEIGTSSANSNRANRAATASETAAADTQSTEARKRIGDAVAYIRGLAQMRGRNADWAERAVRYAVSLPANEAIEQHVVDLGARDVADLLVKLDGRTVQTVNGSRRLATAHASFVTLEPDWRNRLLAVIADPNVALILVTIGVYGLFFEFANPGFMLPGVAGAISLLLGLFALQLLPISYTGLALVFLGLAFLIAEAFLPTFGTLGFGGIVAFAAGALMLVDTSVPGYGVPLPVIAGLSAASVVFIFAVSRFALKARRRPIVTGAEAMIGSIGEILDETLSRSTDDADHAMTGWAQVHGERWRVRALAALPAGARVRVTAREGLVLTVEPIAAPSQPPPPQQGESP